jgi:hypothetical protein
MISLRRTVFHTVVALSAPSATSCDFRDYMPPNTFVAPRANCDH